MDIYKRIADALPPLPKVFEELGIPAAGKLAPNYL
jgi:hypothetical protein